MNLMANGSLLALIVVPTVSLKGFDIHNKRGGGIFLQVTSPTQLRSVFVLNNNAKLRMCAFSELIIHMNWTALY